MLKKGDRAPSFSLEQLDGVTRSLDEILAAGPAVITLFKISCPVCQLALPFLQRIAESGKIPVIAISQDGAQGTEKFRKQFKISMPTLLDKEEEGYPVSNAFGITHVPSVFVVNAGGTVDMAFDGFSKREIAAIGDRAGVGVFGEKDNVPEWKAG
jgi:peroxiredoxin